MNRRDTLRALVALGAATGSFLAASLAQGQGKVAKVGWLSSRVATHDTGLQSFLQAMRGLGYVEGKNLVVEARHAEGVFERFPALARELVQLNPDVIVVGGTPGMPAAQQATRTIPVVMGTSSDPVANGFVASLAHPGGNITGLSNISTDLGTKHLELLISMVPKLSRVAVLMDPRVVSQPLILKNVESVASKLSLRVLAVEARTPEELDRAFVKMKSEHVDGVIVGLSAFFFIQGKRVAALAAAHRLPMIFPSRESVEAGGLMSYGQDLDDSYRRAAVYVDKILKGAKPGDLPVEQASKLEMVINLKTARALGIKIPQTILVRADKVIE